MNNVGKPWVFFGLGCHISQWSADQSDRAAQPSLGEKMLTHTGAAAAVMPSYTVSTAYSTAATASWQRPTNVLQHRFFKIGGNISF